MKTIIHKKGWKRRRIYSPILLGVSALVLLLLLCTSPLLIPQKPSQTDSLFTPSSSHIDPLNIFNQELKLNSDPPNHSNRDIILSVFSSLVLSEKDDTYYRASATPADISNESTAFLHFAPLMSEMTQKTPHISAFQSKIIIGAILTMLIIISIITIYLRVKTSRSSTELLEQKERLENLKEKTQILRYQEKIQKPMQKSVILKKSKSFKNKLDTYTDSFKISIIIPLYNEEKSIKRVLARIPPHSTYQIIIVNDGSTDKSLKKVKEIEDPRITLINHEKNNGYGSAVLSGFQRAEGDIIVTLDSDGQHDPREIPKLISPILQNQADIVIGSRYLGKSTYKVPAHTKVGEKLISKMLWLFFRQKVRNNQSGFRAFKNQHVSLFNNMIFTGFGLCTEVIFKAALRNLKIKEVPIRIRLRKFGNSYVKVARIISSISVCLFIYVVKKTKIIKLIPSKLIKHGRKMLLDIFD
jgi:hypothetical protein